VTPFRITILTILLLASGIALAVPTGGRGISQQGTVLQAGTGAVLRTIEDKARDTVSVKDFGADSTGGVNTTSAIVAALAAADALAPSVVDLYLPAGDYLVSTSTIAAANVRGHAFVGPGRLVASITGGLQKLNSYGDSGQYVFGREYLSHFHKMLIAGSAPSVVASGDSTTAGDGASAPYIITDTIITAAANSGPPIGTVTNRGQSGKATSDWVTTYLAGDRALNPDLLILRWGINDPYLGRTLAQFTSDLRSGLATIRAASSTSQMSIILCTPNSTSDTPGNRDERWYEQIAPVIRQAARDYQAVFVDVYAYLRDSRSATDWMDNPYGDGRHIHPQNVMNLWIGSLLADVMFPRLIGNGLYNYPSSLVTTATYTDPPTAYRNGVSFHRATTGWPLDGAVLTVRSVNNITAQYNWAYASAVTDGRWRQSLSGGGGWTPWVTYSTYATEQDGSVFSPATSTPASTFAVGFNLHRANNGASYGWPVDGSVATVRQSNGPTLQIDYSFVAGAPRIQMRVWNIAGSAWGSWLIVPGQAAAQVDSTAPDVATLKADFNSLLAKMRTAGLLAP
jgi:hypothetical protein